MQPRTRTQARAAARWSWPPAATRRCGRARRTRPRRAAAAWPWPSAPARPWPTWSSSSSIRPRCRSPDAPAFLLSEALRGEGARLVDDDDRESSTRCCRATSSPARCTAQLQRGRRVYLSPAPPRPATTSTPTSAPLAATAPRSSGLDLARDLLPVAPAAHYCMGGVRTDTWGRTDVPGPLRRRRGRLHRRPGRQPAGLELAARMPGLRRARRGGGAQR